jgi:hypothetical protein
MSGASAFELLHIPADNLWIEWNDAARRYELTRVLPSGQPACAVDPALVNQAGEDTGAIRASRIGKLMTAAAAARAISAYHIH